MPISQKRRAELAPLNLNESDLANLRESGLTDATIRANGLYSSRVALEIPYRDLDGTLNGFVRRRLHTQPVNKKGRYRQAKGSAKRAYFPRASLASLSQGNGPIVVVEGEKKALALSQAGYTVIGLGGVGNWNVTQTAELIPDIAAIPLRYRTVLIVFDYDPGEKSQADVDYQRRKFADALRRFTGGDVDVREVILPPGPEGQKQGADDFLVAHGAEAFAKLVEQAQPVPQLQLPSIDSPQGRTEACNALRLVESFVANLRFVPPWRQWIGWDEARWRVDNAAAMVAAKAVGKELWQCIKQKEAGDDGLGPMFSFVRGSNSEKGLNAMVALATTDPVVIVGVDQLDAHPMLLNTPNGTIDLATGKLRPHCREDFLTLCTPTRFKTTAKCPTWDRFLQTIFAGDTELIGYVQKLLGYALTGLAIEHILPIFYGKGSNGKGVLCETIRRVLGDDFAIKGARNLLMCKRGDSHPTELADLFGKRFVYCNETNLGHQFDEALVKDLTGNDRIRARRMREDHWEFSPTHLLVLSTNNLPKVNGTDYGFWRRAKVIPFLVTFSDQTDKYLGDKLAAEAEGILRWLVDGCLAWQREGLVEPAAVIEASRAYRVQEDELGGFLATHCIIDNPAAITPAKPLYQAFCRATGSELSPVAFGRDLKGRGYMSKGMTRAPFKGHIGYCGIALRDLPS